MSLITTSMTVGKNVLTSMVQSENAMKRKRSPTLVSRTFMLDHSASVEAV